MHPLLESSLIAASLALAFFTGAAVAGGLQNTALLVRGLARSLASLWYTRGYLDLARLAASLVLHVSLVLVLVHHIVLWLMFHSIDSGVASIYPVTRGYVVQATLVAMYSASFLAATSVYSIVKTRMLTLSRVACTLLDALIAALGYTGVYCCPELHWALGLTASMLTVVAASHVARGLRVYSLSLLE